MKTGFFRLLVAGLLISMAFSLAGCGSLFGPVNVTGVALSKTALELKAGESITLVATISPAGATDKGLKWTSSDEDVATVDTSGKVTTSGVSGSATITATTTDGAFTAACVVSIPTSKATVLTELEKLAAKLTKTQTEFDATNARVVSLSTQVDKADTGMNDLCYVTDKIVQLDSQMGTIETVATALTPIPLVGTVASTMGSAVKKVHTPVESLSKKVATASKVLTSSRDTMGSIKEKVDKIKAAMASISGNIEYSKKAVAKANEYLASLEDPALIAKLDPEIKKLSTAINGLNKGLVALNEAQDAAGATLTTLGDSIASISTVKTGIAKVMTPLNSIKGATDEIDSMLGKTYKVNMPWPVPDIEFNLKSMLSKIGDQIKVVQDFVMDLIDPVLNKLKIAIPEIPGLDTITALVDKAQDYYDKIKASGDKIIGAAAGIIDAPTNLKAGADAILGVAGLTI